MESFAFEQFIRGATAMGSAMIALYFFRFWRTTRDQIFIYFSLCFALFSAIRIGLGIVGPRTEPNTYFYLVRLAAFILLIFGVIQKNRKKST